MLKTGHFIYSLHLRGDRVDTEQIATAINSVDLRLQGEFVKATEASLARDLCLIVAKPELESTVIYQKMYACQERLNFSILL